MFCKSSNAYFSRMNIIYEYNFVTNILCKLSLTIRPFLPHSNYLSVMLFSFKLRCMCIKMKDLVSTIIIFFVKSKLSSS